VGVLTGCLVGSCECGLRGFNQVVGQKAVAGKWAVARCDFGQEVFSNSDMSLKRSQFDLNRHTS